MVRHRSGRFFQRWGLLLVVGLVLCGAWSFIVMTLNGQQFALFIDARGNTFRGKEGDVLEGRYRLLRIGPDSVDLAYLDGRGRQSIRLTGQ